MIDHRILDKMTEDLESHWIDIRRHIHRHPELSFREKNTQSFICSILDDWSIDYQKGEDLYYVIAVINPEKKSTIALRADIDALPIEEQNDQPYKSLNEGVMHACGHDVHSSCLLGAIDLLRRLKDQLNHRVICIFQPGEEKLPGGAKLLMEKGIIQTYNPACIFAQHVFPDLPAGQLGFKEGPYMASADEIRVKFEGRGGHAATPHQNDDLVYIASLFVIDCQSLISRRKNPVESAVLSFGKMNTRGGATNVMSSELNIEGTLRSMNEEYRQFVKDKLLDFVEAYQKKYEINVTVDIMDGYPVLYNDTELTAFSRAKGTMMLGSEQVKDLPIRLSAEDFAWYSQDMKACFYRLGTGFIHKENYSVHHPKFDIDERAIAIGAKFFAYLCLTF